jgi:hypothetical protein
MFVGVARTRDAAKWLCDRHVEFFDPDARLEWLDAENDLSMAGEWLVWETVIQSG